jgi:hypothetical protein
MAFCNSCGANLTAGSRFCSKCGAPILASTLPSPGASAASPQTSASSVSVPPTAAVAGVPAAPPQGSGALKIILIAVCGLLLLAVISAAAIGFFAVHALKSRDTHIHQDGSNTKIETPFGNVEVTKDQDEAARNIGVDLYPGAQVRQEGASSATIGSMHTATLVVDSSDPVEKVSAFYKQKFPDATVTSCDAGRCTIVSNDHGRILTINIDSEGDKTKIQITNVSHKSDAENSSSH